MLLMQMCRANVFSQGAYVTSTYRVLLSSLPVILNVRNLNAYDRECLEDENTAKPSEKDNPLCQLLPKASPDTGDLHYFTSQPVQHLLAGIHVAINLDHSEHQKLFVRSLDELSVWGKPFLDLLPHIAQLRNIQKEVPEEVTAFRALHSRCKCEISTTVSQLPMLCHHSQEATLRNSVVKISHSTSRIAALFKDR